MREIETRTHCALEKFQRLKLLAITTDLIQSSPPKTHTRTHRIRAHSGESVILTVTFLTTHPTVGYDCAYVPPRTLSSQATAAGCPLV